MKREMKIPIAGLIVLGFCLACSGCTGLGSAVPVSTGDRASNPARMGSATVSDAAVPVLGPDELRDWSRLSKEGREHLLLRRFDMAEHSLLAAFMISKHFRESDIRRRVSFSNLERLAERYHLGHYDAAAQRVLKIIVIESEGKSEIEYPGLSGLFLKLGELQFIDGALEDAEVSYQRALDLRIAKSGLKSAFLIKPYQNLSGLELQRDRVDRAVGYSEKALALTESHLGQNASDTVMARLQMGGVYVKNGQHSDAETQYHRVVVTQRGIEESSITEAAALNALANVYLKMDRLEEAAQSVDLALSIFEFRNIGGLDQAIVLDTKAQILGALGEIDAAVRLFNEVMVEANSAPPDAARSLYETYESFLIQHDRTLDASRLRAQIDMIDEFMREGSTGRQITSDPITSDPIEGEPTNSEPFDDTGEEQQSGATLRELGERFESPKA